MSENATEQVQTPGLVLLIAGGVLALFYAGYALWSGIGLITGCMGSGVLGMMAANGDSDVLFSLGCSMWGLLLNALGFLIYLALTAAGAFVATGGMSLQSLENADKVRKTMIIAVVIPVVGILTNLLTTIATISFCGALSGTVPQLIPLILGVVAAFLVNGVMSDESVVSAFES